MVGGITGHIREVVEQSEAKMSRAVGNALQQLEQEIGVAASSVTAMSEQATRRAVADAHCNLQTQLDQTRAESQHKDAVAPRVLSALTHFFYSCNRPGSVLLGLRSSAHIHTRNGKLKDTSGSQQSDNRTMAATHSAIHVHIQ